MTNQGWYLAGFRLGVVLVVAGLCAGCSQSKFKPTYPARGHVNFNGKPAGGAKVILYPSEDLQDPLVRPMGVVDSAGDFILSTYTRGDGVPAGSYLVVVVTGIPQPGGRSGASPAAPEPIPYLPQRYARPETSGLSVTAEPKENVFATFELTR